MGAKESGASFIAGVLAKLPEADRAAAQALFSKPEAEAAVVVIGDGVLARTDYSRQMDALTAKQTELNDRQAELNDWFGQNEAALKEYVQIKPEFDRLKAGGGAPPAAPQPPAIDVNKIKEDLAKELDQRDRGFAGAFALGVNLASQHMHMFSEPLDMNELLSDPKIGRPVDGQPGRVYGLQDAYNAKHGERVTAKRSEAENARIQKLVDEKVAEKLRTQPQAMPFPLRDPSPSPLDALAATERKPADYTVDSAVEAYQRLVEQRNQGSAA